MARPSKSSRSAAAGFTLLEVMIALAILAISLVALSEINAGAIAMHSYAKKLTVATFLAKSKMLEIESKLDAEGLPAAKENISPSDGTFEEEGFPGYKWKVEVSAPDSDNLDPSKMMSMILGGGTGEEGSDSSSPMGGLGAMLGLGGGAAPGGSTAGGPTPAGGLAGGLGAMGGAAMAGPAQMMVSEITKMVREVQLTVTWMDGKNPQEFTVVEHIVSMGPATPAGGTSNSGLKNPTPGTTPSVPGRPGNDEED